MGEDRFEKLWAFVEHEIEAKGVPGAAVGVLHSLMRRPLPGSRCGTF